MNCHDGQPTILVVEDDTALRRLVVRVLTKGGFEVISSGRAADALELVRQRRGAFELAIVDIIMPGMSGLDLAGDLDREYPELKILYISGYVNSVAAEVISRRAPELMLFKPFTAAALLDRVQALLAALPRREPARASNSGRPVIRDGTSG